jgi:hypothetical protein
MTITDFSSQEAHANSWRSQGGAIDWKTNSLRQTCLRAHACLCTDMQTPGLWVMRRTVVLLSVTTHGGMHRAASAEFPGS